MKIFAARLFLAMTLVCGGVCWVPAHAEQVVHVGTYDVHYVVLGTTFLSADVARQYGISRAKNIALINISVLRNGQAVAAKIQGQARDLLDRRVELPFREIKERTSVYYIAALKFSEQEHWRFELRVIPAGENEPFDVRFEQQIYVE